MTKAVMEKQAEWAFEIMMTWGFNGEHVARAYAEVSQQAGHPGSAMHWEQVADIIKATHERNGDKQSG